MPVRVGFVSSHFKQSALLGRTGGLEWPISFLIAKTRPRLGAVQVKWRSTGVRGFLQEWRKVKMELFSFIGGRV